MTDNQTTKFCVGNWKAYGSQEDLRRWATGFEPYPQLDVVMCLPYPLIAQAVSLLEKKAMVGSQDIAAVGPGKHTGETTAELISDCGASWTLLGHSERRTQGESNTLIATKLERALQAGLRPILCVGETAEQRQAGQLEEILSAQLEECVSVGAHEKAKQLVIAYEPVWAIGTGVAASDTDAQQACAFVRAKYAQLYGSDKIAVIYGGSVEAANTASFMNKPDINGLLVGGASLQADSFSSICQQVTLVGN